jgi:hypothetical protein
MIGMRSVLVYKNFLKELLGGDFLIHPSALLDIFVESKILDLVFSGLDSCVDVPRSN